MVRKKTQAQTKNSSDGIGEKKLKGKNPRYLFSFLTSQRGQWGCWMSGWRTHSLHPLPPFMQVDHGCSNYGVSGYWGTFPNDNCLLTQTHTRGKYLFRGKTDFGASMWKSVEDFLMSSDPHLHAGFHCCLWSLGSVTGICRMTCRAIPGLPSLLWVTSQQTKRGSRCGGLTVFR